MTVTPCAFRNRDGHLLRGLFFDPPPPRRAAGVGLIYLPGIVLGYTAVHRLACEVLGWGARAGVPGYVFDHAGIGYSEGATLAGTHEALAYHVNSGGLVPDTLEAMRHFRLERAVERILFVGHCAGALTASYAAGEDPGVAGMVLLSPPPLRSAGPDGSAAPMPAEAATQRLRLYREKLLSGRAWGRLASGRTDYRTLVRAIRARLPRASRRAADLPFNERLIEGIRAVSRRGQVRIIAGDHDERVRELAEMVRCVEGPRVSSVVLPDTSHGFVTDESMRLLSNEIDGFLRAFGGRDRTG